MGVQGVGAQQPPKSVGCRMTAFDFGESFTCPSRSIRYGCRESGQACPKADLRTATSAVCSNSHKLATNPDAGLPRIPNGRDDAIGAYKEGLTHGKRPTDEGWAHMS